MLAALLGAPAEGEWRALGLSFWSVQRAGSSPPLLGHVPGGRLSLSLLAAPAGLDPSNRKVWDSRQMEPRVPWTNWSCFWPTGMGVQQNILSSQPPWPDCPRPPRSEAAAGGASKTSPAKSKSGQAGREGTWV